MKRTVTHSRYAPLAGAATLGLAMGIASLVLAGDVVAQSVDPGAGILPATLAETGLYEPGTTAVAPGNLGFAPQYPLWTDGASKRRWISLPEGETIDASDSDAWEFPAGTRFWKEFAFHGRPVETRYMEKRSDGSWLFAAYAWDSDGENARLAPSRGVLRALEFDDGKAHAIPSQTDCGVCHLSGRSPVLGFSTLQLSDERDREALHAEPAPPPDVRLSDLVNQGLVRGLDDTLLLAPPRISTAFATQRAALGYLHANCGHCHNPYGPLNRLGLYLHQSAQPGRSAALATTFRVPLMRTHTGLAAGTEYRILPGDPDLSAIPQRMSTRGSPLQMPPIGSVYVDDAAVTLINRWITGSRIARASVRQNVSDEHEK